MITLESTPEEVLAEFERVRVMYTLKNTMRYESKRDRSKHSESVGEHLFGMFVLVQYFLPLEDPEGRLDKQRIHELILYHEIGEIETGDIISYKKTDAQKEFERSAAERVAKQLPDSLSTIAQERFNEHESGTSPEAKFVLAIDKIEPIFELFPKKVWPYFKLQNISKEMSLGNKMAATESFPYMRLFLIVWTDYLASHNVFAE